jgi:hypothetical protein
MENNDSISESTFITDEQTLIGNLRAAKIPVLVDLERRSFLKRPSTRTLPTILAFPFNWTIACRLGVSGSLKALAGTDKSSPAISNETAILSLSFFVICVPFGIQDKLAPALNDSITVSLTATPE